MKCILLPRRDVSQQSLQPAVGQEDTRRPSADRSGAPFCKPYSGDQQRQARKIGSCPYQEWVEPGWVGIVDYEDTEECYGDQRVLEASDITFRGHAAIKSETLPCIST